MIKINLLKNAKTQAAEGSLPRRPTAAERTKLWREKNPEKAKAAVHRWRENNQEYLREYDKKRNKERRIPPEKQKEYQERWRAKQTPEMRKERWLLKTYGMGLSEYNLMLSLQGGVCAICGCSAKDVAGKYGTLNVDHDHETGAIRGLLCWRCNSSIGKFDDSPELLEAAAAYLRKHKAKQTGKAA